MEIFRRNGESKVSKLAAASSADFKNALRHPERDNAFIAEVYQRLSRVFGDEVIVFSGATIHLISPDRKVSDIDVFVSESKLFINDVLKRKIERAGFTVSVLINNKIYAITDNKSGIKIETANSSLKVDGKILTDHREICRILQCKEDTDTLVGFSANTIMKNAMIMQIDSGKGGIIDLMLPDPVHQIGLKYNLLRLRGGTKDIEDMKKIMQYYFGDFESFLNKKGVERLKKVGEYLGPDFENNILEILRN